ncbi:hypothetical protein IW261DRAFT_1560735 [Armillaria novae-zelandiae]|uniref:C2H2-type domain-containing protein n=1 Tax=Armillaria novae-zelandiae TaxID=153914 RepID=A0AA39UMN8_9AGAR|nr:hypothetical protein IW261DRAFT_1560735 [Armillaria novae-zelandiae]
MAFFADSSIFPHGVDDMLFNSAASSVHTDSTSSPSFTDVDQYFSSTGDISFSPPSIVDNAFIFGDPMFHSDFAPELTNEFSFMNLYSPSFHSVTEPIDAFVSYSASPSLPHVEGTDEDAEFDLDPEFDSGGNCDCVEYDSESVNASNSPQASSPSSEYRDWSPSSSSSDPCTVVDSRDDTPNPFAEDSSDTCCSDDDEADYDEPAAGSRKRARTSKAKAKSTSNPPKSQRTRTADFRKSSERWKFQDEEMEVRCMDKTCDVVLKTLNKAVDHFNEYHGHHNPVRCVFSDCDIGATNVGNMRRHFLSANHQSSRFPCSSCKQRFTRKDAMLRHVRNMKGRCMNQPMGKVARKGRARKAKA